MIASWGVMTILHDPRAIMAKSTGTLKPGGVWAFNTYDNRSLWARMFGSRWYIASPTQAKSITTGRYVGSSTQPASTSSPDDATVPTQVSSVSCSYSYRTQAKAFATSSSKRRIS